MQQLFLLILTEMTGAARVEVCKTPSVPTE